MTNRSIFAVAFVSTMLVVGCEKKPEPPKAEPPKSTSPAPTPTPTPPATGHGLEVVELGETSVDGIKIKASRDKGEIKAGGDSPIDIWLNGGLGDAAAVRFWIGTEDGKGSVKAKADVEAGHWHTHAEVPEPIPAGSRLWVEIDAKDGKKTKTSFDLKA